MPKFFNIIFEPFLYFHELNLCVLMWKFSNCFHCIALPQDKRVNGCTSRSYYLVTNSDLIVSKRTNVCNKSPRSRNKLTCSNREFKLFTFCNFSFRKWRQLISSRSQQNAQVPALHRLRLLFSLPCSHGSSRISGFRTTWQPSCVGVSGPDSFVDEN